MPGLKSTLLTLLLCFCGVAVAEPLPAPDGPVILTISGNIKHHNGDGMARFDREMLEDLDWQQVRTFTSFTEGEQVFGGPRLDALLNRVGASGEHLHATAINDYTVAIPVGHAAAHDVLLAMDWNGEQMRIRTKGPIWVVYPLEEADAKAQKFDPEMIWQLDRIRIE